MPPLSELLSQTGAAVRSTRTTAGYSRRKLAEEAGVSERYLNELEKGDANASIGVLARIAEALGVSLAAFLGGPSAGPVLPAGSALSRLLLGLSPAELPGATAALEKYIESRRKSLRGIALLGLRGAGKSTLGRKLADKHGLPFISITREIETRAGMSLADLFNLGGAESYRTLENAVALDLSQRQDRIVLETAGGIVGNSEALNIILGAFQTVWLRATPEEHLARVAHQGDMRPMDGNPKALDHLRALLAQREGEYSRAEIALDTSGKTEAACVLELETLVGAVLTRA